MISLFKKSKKAEECHDRKIDLELLSLIQPAGGVSFKESYIKKGDGYETCVHIYDVPLNVENLWLEDILNIEGVISTVDIHSSLRNENIDGLNSGMKEERSRYYTEKEDVARIDAQENYNVLKELYQDVTRYGEIIKYVIIRLFVSGRTIKELEATLKFVYEKLESNGIRGAVFLNEQKYEFKSLFDDYTSQQNYLNKREGIPMSSLSLAAGNFFNFTRLHDPFGTYLGTTSTRGTMLLDIFHKDKKRRFYNSVIMGDMGSGKSTVMKKLLLDRAIRNDIIRAFDITGEFKTLINTLGGKIIALDGSDGIINPLQVLKTAKTEKLSFMQHISKLSVIYKIVAPSSNDEDCDEFENLMRNFYIQRGLYSEEIPERNLKITGLNTNMYPTFSDFLMYVRSVLYSDVVNKIINKELTRNKISRLEKIELKIENLVKNYGNIFDGYSTIENINNEQIVCFSARNLTALKKEIFNAQIFSALNLIWDGMVTNGEVYKNLFDSGKIDFEDIKRYFVLIDEAHRLINVQNLTAVKYITDFEREARKYFGGIVFASQSIRDFVPEGADSEAINIIKTLFELTQYKFIMQQDSNTLDDLRKIFEGQLSESEIKSIPYQGMSECILSIKGVGNFKFKVEASDEELELFEGGA